MIKRLKINKLKIIGNILGNFGVAFFSPLVGGNVAETIFSVGLTFNMMLIISLFSSIFVTGLSLSKELLEWSRGE